MSKRTFRTTINIALAIIVGTLLVARSAAEERIVVDQKASGPFSLIDHNGRPVTDQDFRGKFMLVFFGYTFCPDVCPIDLQIISKAVDALGEAGTRVQPIFITVDPERDTVEVLARYVGHFHPRLLGLTGTPEQAAIAAQSYGVLYIRALDAMSDSDEAHAQYLVDHSALTYLVGPDGRFLAAYAHGTDPKKLAAEISKHLTGHPS